MKTYRICTLAFILVMMHLHAFQTQMQFQETSSYFKDICFVSDQIGWAAGSPHWDATLQSYTGSIMKTTDGGDTWTFQTVSTQSTLKGVTFIDQNTGWAVGEAGVIVHTTDGGAHWTLQSVDTNDDFAGIVFIDALNGWAASIKVTGYDWLNYPNDWQGTIWRTSDGGIHWQKQTMPANTGLLRRIDFIDNQNGWTVGTRKTTDEFGDPDHRAAIYHTSDGGQIWTEQFGLDLKISLTGVDFLDANELFAVQFLNENDGWAINNGSPVKLAHTLNGGTDWQWVDTPVFDPLGIGFAIVMGDLFFTDATHGWGTGGLGKVICTENGGTTWLDRSMSGDLAFRHCIALHFLDNQKGWIAGEGLFYTNDAGLSWNEFDLGYTQDFHDIQFTDNMHGWTVGDYGTILCTEDSGLSWSGQNEADIIYADLKGLSFVQDTIGWAVGDYGAVIKITGGKSAQTHVDEKISGKTMAFGLEQNYPNPFNPSTSIRFTLPIDHQVTLTLFNVRGEKVAQLYQGYLQQGRHQFIWNAEDYPSGIYICRLEAGSHVDTKRLVLER